MLALGWCGTIAKHLGVPLVPDILEIVTVVVVVAAGVTMFRAALRVPGKRTPWDRVGGTMVRYRASRGSTGAVP